MQIPDCMQMADNRLHLEMDAQFTIMSKTIGLIKTLTIQGFDQDKARNWLVRWAWPLLGIARYVDIVHKKSLWSSGQIGSGVDRNSV